MSGPRTLEAAFLLPWLGVLLLTPPVIFIVSATAREAGLPLFVPYLFIVWSLLIVAAWVLSRRLRAGEMNPARPGVRAIDAPGPDGKS